MGIIKPATPGFIVTLAATVLLVVVVFCVPYFKSVYFIRASVVYGGITGNITLGTLGYCYELPGNVTCSKPSIGYEFDPNKILGNDLPIEIPTVVVKWLTYALVLHIVALGLSGVSAVFGLLAHIREMSMSCFSSCISGMAAFVALLAFIFDLVLFFVAKARINKVPGGSATIGSAIWLTLAAWVLLFFSGVVFSIGRCCISDRPRAPKGSKRHHDVEDDSDPKFNAHTESLRLDAIKAEADRKARAAGGTHEVGLPSFHEYEARPLRNVYNGEPQYLEEEDEHQEHQPYSDNATGQAGQNLRRNASQPGHFPGGYAGGAPGTRAIDDYYGGGGGAAAGTLGVAAVGAGVAAGGQHYASSTSTSSQHLAGTYPPQDAYAQQQHPSRQASFNQTQQQEQYNDPYGPHYDTVAAAAYPYNAQQQQSYEPQPAVRQMYPAPVTGYPPPEQSYGAPAHLTPGYQPSTAYPTEQSYATAYDQTPNSNMQSPPQQFSSSSYFPNDPYQGQNQGGYAAGAASPSPMHVNTALGGAAGAFGIASPHSQSPSISPGPTRRQSMGGPRGPRMSPTREGSQAEQQHNWQAAGPASVDDHTISEAPPQYNPYEPSTSGTVVRENTSRGGKR